jgi:predicted transcriptional regulator
MPSPFNPDLTSHPVLRLIPGRLEAEVMEDLWTYGASRVRDVMRRLDRSVAYTTVMTTLHRLYRKNLLQRNKDDRAYLYSPLVTREEWKYQVARAVVAKLLTGPQALREVLIASLLEAVGQQEVQLLEEIEKRMRRLSANRD